VWEPALHRLLVLFGGSQHVRDLAREETRAQLRELTSLARPHVGLPSSAEGLGEGTAARQPAETCPIMAESAARSQTPEAPDP
jgi:hypothetical protein